MTITRFPLALTLVLLVSGIPSSVDAQPAADFYKNRQMRPIVGHAVGNDYDIGSEEAHPEFAVTISGQSTPLGGCDAAGCTT